MLKSSLFLLVSITFLTNCSPQWRGVDQSSYPMIESAHARIKKRKVRARKRRTVASKKKEKLVLETATAVKIQKRQAKRIMEIDRFKVLGAIGEQEDGLLGIRTLKKVKKSELEKVKKLVASENKDRNMLYDLIAKDANYGKEMKVTLRKSFFESYQEWVPKGTYYFKNGKWQKKY